MTGGAWMPPREDRDAAAAAAAAASSRARGRPEKPSAEWEPRAPRWRSPLAPLLVFLAVLLADRLWLCPAGAQLAPSEADRRGPGASGNLAATASAWASSSSREPARQEQREAGEEARPEPPSRPPPLAWAGTNGSLPGGPSLSPAPRDPSSCPEVPASPAPALDLEAVCRARELLQGPLEAAAAAAAGRGASFSAWSAAAAGAAGLAEHFGAFRLPFCRGYTLWDLLVGMASPESLDCSLARLRADWAARHSEACGSCLEAYQRLDQHAQEKYQEFDLLLEKYLQADDYSVRSCLGDCKAVYKAWLCSEYFNVTQLQCPRRVPCKQYCLEVQTKCPFVLPDNDELIYGGLPGFICTGLLESQLPNQEAKCCDIQWDSCSGRQPKRGYNASSTDSEPFHGSQDAHHRHHRHHQQHYHLYYHHHQYHPQPHPSLLPVSAGSRLSHSKIRLCVLVLMLLHTMVSFSSVHGGGGGGGSAASGALSLEALPAMEESRAREE